MNAEKIRAGVARDLQRMRDRGWETEHCSIQPDASAGPTVRHQLASWTFDRVVIGVGVRLWRLEVFEAVVNVVHKVAPGVNIAFNATLLDVPEAAARQFPT